MKIILRAGGVIRSGPERELTDDYLKRSQNLAKGTGFLSIEEQQVDMRSAKSRAAQTRLLFEPIPSGAKTVIFDERGKNPTSRKIAQSLGGWRDDGVAQLYLVIGPADGFEPSEIPSGAMRWAFGAQTWPHKMVRLMAAEQIYRALSIHASTPYHRD